MSDALPLPDRPDVERYRAFATALADVATDLAAAPAVAGDHDAALQRWAASLVEYATSACAVTADEAPDRSAARAFDTLITVWRQLCAPGVTREHAMAQAFLAQAHGFLDWDAFLAHVTALADPSSPIARFEAAADAIVGGDAERVRSAIADLPSLVYARSTREHRSTLLHYVAANGVEDFRQATPPTIVAIATALLDAGADVNAESEAYGGGATPLGLAATSIHPQRAGVQIALLELLMARGAWIDRPGVAGNVQTAVLGCLANGQPEAAAFLARRGARLGLVEEAGTGLIDEVRRRLSGPDRQEDRQLAFMYACRYGYGEIAELLLAHGASRTQIDGDPSLEARLAPDSPPPSESSPRSNGVRTEPLRVRVRAERPADAADVRRITLEAFGQPGEADLVDRLRASCADALSLVAEDDSGVVGHLLFTPVRLESADDVVVGMGLAPMAVARDRQRRGAGAALIRHGIAVLRQRGVPFVVVVGHPGYYPRFGFERASAHRIASQWPDMPDDAFMVLILDHDATRGVRGTARYRPEFDAVT